MMIFEYNSNVTWRLWNEVPVKEVNDLHAFIYGDVAEWYTAQGYPMTCQPSGFETSDAIGLILLLKYG